MKISPQLSTHPPFAPHTAKIEVDARPGTPLGGQFPALNPDVLKERHLAYLRHAYRHVPETRRELERLAASYRYGHNHVTFITPHPVVGENIISAVQGIAQSLPYREDFESEQAA